MPMADEIDPADALRALLEQNRRAKQAVYKASIEREKAEEELAQTQKWLEQQREEDKNLAEKNAALEVQLTQEREMGINLTQNEMRATARAEKAESRSEKFEKILSRVEQEIYDAIEEEDEFAPMDEMLEEDALTVGPEPPRFPSVAYQIAKAESAIDAAIERSEKEVVPDVPLGGGVGRPPEDKICDIDCSANKPPEEFVEDLGPEESTPSRMVELKALNRQIMRENFVGAFIGSRCTKMRTVAIFGSAPFLLMLALGMLANRGIYIDIFRPLWVNWIPGWLVQLMSFVVPAVLFTAYLLLCKRPSERKVSGLKEEISREESMPEEVEKPRPSFRGISLQGKHKKEEPADGPTFDADLARALAEVFKAEK